MLAPALTALVTYLGQVVPVRLDIADGAGVEVPPERGGRLAVLAGALQDQGFTPLTAVAPDSPGGAIYAQVLVDPAGAVGAWAIDMARGPLVNSYVELITEWEDGTAVSTVTHSSPSIYEPLPRVEQLALPG